ncbi:MAG: hypothetical protein DCC75_06170 [Proteobacteria bacterium]|nr:MAG: hypothetical protein DCC75_06170 [Pseudomonadota bacterium]
MRSEGLPDQTAFARICVSLVLSLIIVELKSQVWAQGSGKLPSYMGVASCASSNCHGSVSPRNATTVLQNEYTTWQKHDAHAQAWLSLTNEDSKKIGAHMGIEAPEREPLCLSCHATYVSDKSREGKTFKVEDGVGCESCHGAAENYLGPHTARDATRKSSVAQGLTEMVAPELRAAMCLDCHYGNKDKTVNHRLIGAGHPRLTFEMDTFQALEPWHWNIDEDYVSRKGDYVPARYWLAGQIERAQRALEYLLDDKLSRSGSGFLAGPELTMLYCYSCHHSLTEKQWKSRDYGGKPGELRLNLASLIVVQEGFQVIAPATAKAIADGLDALHTGGSLEDARAEAKKLRSILNEASIAAVSQKFEEKSVNSLLKKLSTYGANQPSLQFEIAEQIAMGLSSLIATISNDGTLHKQEIDQIYSSLSTPEAFDPAGFSSACQGLLGKL